MTKTIAYEWDAETIRDGDVEDHYHADTLSEVLQFVPPEGATVDLVLVRDVIRSDCPTFRSWAYLNAEDGLPEYFEDASGRKVARVPKRFHKEVRSINL